MQNYHHDRDDHAEHTADDACTLTQGGSRRAPVRLRAVLVLV
jgi:hypothetical protein